MTKDLDIPSVLGPLDWAVFALVLIATFAMVLYGEMLKRRDLPDPENEEASFLDLMIMGRRLTMPMFVATLVATWYGGIFGVTQIAFEKGIYNFLTQGVFWYVTYLIFAFFLVDRLRRFDVLTLPEMVGRMFGPRSEKLAGVFNFMNVVPVAYAISLGLFLRAVFGGGSLPAWTAAGTGLVIAYSLSGGLRAVVFSDIVQFFVMCAAVFCVLAASVLRYGGWSYLRAELPDGHFSALGGEHWSTALVWGLIALSTLVDPNFYHRCFAARSTETAKKGILVCTLIWIGFDICTTGGAMYARAALPEADSANAYLVYSLQVLPPGLRGFFLAGVLATILSTLDSYIFLAGTTLAYDLVPRRWKGKVGAHHLGVAAVGCLAVGLSLVFDGGIKDVWKTLGSYSAACLLFPVLYGYVFPGRLGDRVFVGVCLAGCAGVTYWRLAEHAGVFAQVDDIYAGIAVTSAGLLLSHSGIFTGARKKPRDVRQ